MARKKRGQAVGVQKDRGKAQHCSIRPPKNLRKTILDVFGYKPSKPLNHKQYPQHWVFCNHDVRRLVMELLSEMASQEKLIDLGRGKYKLVPKQVAATEGTIQITKFGRGFVLLEDGSEIKLSKGATGSAFWGDTVKVEWASFGRKTVPFVSEVTKNARSYVVIIEQIKVTHLVIQQTPTTRQLLHSTIKSQCHRGDKVLLEMVNDRNDDSPVGNVTRVLGQEGDNDVEMHAILAEFGLPLEFPPEVYDEAATFTLAQRQRASTQLKLQRRDMRTSSP